MRYLLIFLLLLPLSLGEVFENEDMTLRLSTYATIDKTADVKDLKVSLFLYPRNDDRQKVINLETDPSSQIINETIIFHDPDSISVVSDIHTKNRLTRIKNSLSFPHIQNSIYTRPAGNIDSDNYLIKRQASKILEGETDYYKAVFLLANWTKNSVNYSLDTLSVEASQKSSWVLRNRYGVCDEITNLFIAFSRSVGIPARYVSGISYTDSDLFEDNWGPHGWAEIYFPDEGWVPFDVTYGQFGYIDAGHIKLRESTQSNQSSVNYEWRGGEISPSDLDFDVNIVNASGEISDYFTFDPLIDKDLTGFSSYNQLLVSVQNPHDFYVPGQIFISKTQGLEFDAQSKQFLLKPYETKQLRFTLRVAELNDEFTYTFPVQVYTKRENKSVSFKAKGFGPVYKRTDFLTEFTQKDVNNSVLINCDNARNYGEVTFSCAVTNTGNTYRNLSVCFEECTPLELAISQTENVSFSFISSHGSYTKNVRVNNSIETVNLTVLDKPMLSIQNLSYPKVLSFNENGTISFKIEKESFSDAFDLSMQLSNSFATKNWEEELVDSSKYYTVRIDSSDLPKKSNFELSLRYEDKNGNLYTKTEQFEITLIDLTNAEKATLALKDTQRFIEKNIILSSLAIFLIVFIITLLILRPPRLSEYDDLNFKE